MTYQEAFNYLVDDLEGNSGKPSIYGDVFGISPLNWKFYARRNGIPDSYPSRKDAYHYYRDEWWDKFYCGDLPDGLDFCLFQWIVNHGPSGVKDLQVCLGVSPDGFIGPETMQAAKDAERKKVMTCFLNRQAAWYEDDARKQPDAPLVGWESRVEKVKKIVGMV